MAKPSRSSFKRRCGPPSRHGNSERYGGTAFACFHEQRLVSRSESTTARRGRGGVWLTTCGRLGPRAEGEGI